MGERLIKPYEISVWEDKLTPIAGTNPVEYRFEENKLAVIGSDKMTGLNKVYDPVFNKKTNGEKTLSFSLRYKYFDPYIGNDGIINPFAALLVNERKIKLHYDNQWYEFIIKDHNESSDGLEWTYNCVDAFVLELSKNGYNLTFDSELNNNHGTAQELAEKVLENTDWRLGEVDIEKQYVEEPIYKATLESTSNVIIINASDDGTPIPEEGSSIYLFYNYIKNQDGKFVQFIIQDNNRNYVIDSNNVITDTNFRITTDLVYRNNAFYYGEEPIISIQEVETQYQANRLVYGPLTTYDPVMERTVDRFKIGNTEVYRYIDYTYTTSDLVMNYIVNGDNFNTLEDGSLQGWNPYVDSTSTIQKLELVTKPELKTDKALVDISKLSQIEGFLKVQFNGALTNDYKNAIFNDGIHNNASFIQSISQGDKFLFRWRAGEGSIDNLQSSDGLRLIVAKYTQDTSTHWGQYYKHIDPNNIILQFDGNPQILNNTIKGGYITTTFDEETEQNVEVYMIDSVAQEPSTKYIYVNNIDNKSYYWDGEQHIFIEVNENNYRPYYYLTATAQKSISNAALTDPTERYGIFVYTTDAITVAAGTYFIQDIQLTRYIEDADGQPVIIGNIPTATSKATEYYYVKPADGMAAEDIETYTTIEALQEGVGSSQSVVPLYNENSEKNLSISASQSNCFNILQTIAETFECWVDLVVEHNSYGDIKQDGQGLRKFVYLKRYVGTDNYAGFKYGVNIQSIERNINSEEIVTKLIVDQSQSDYTDKGYITIADAPSNPSGESYVLNFNYYYNQGLLDRTIGEKDRLTFIQNLTTINNQLKELEQKRDDLEATALSLKSKLNVFTELIETAKDTKSQAIIEFEDLTGQSYEEYYQKHLILDNDDRLTEEETILEILGNLYNSSAMINNYSGLLTNIQTEYDGVDNELYGYKSYTVKIWVDTDNNNQRHVFVELNDYLPGFKFTFGGNTYTSTVSKKYWDVVGNAIQISFTAPSGYTVSASSYIINDKKVAKFRITNPNITIVGIEEQIEDLIEHKTKVVNQFENKYRRFISEGTWSSTDYIDAELYYLDAVQVSNTSAEPTVSYTINVVEISELEGFEWYIFDAGDKTYIEDTEFFGWANVNGHLTPAREEVIVSEVEWHLDRPEDNVITVQNYKTRFEDLFQRISAAVQTVQYNEATYAKMSSLLDANGTINQDVLLDSLNRISGEKYNLTSDGSVRIDGDRIIVQNLTNTANVVVLNSEGLRISADGGRTWKTAIDGRGINIGAVYTGTLNTENVIIGSSENPSFRWDKSGISAYQIPDGSDIYDLKTYVRYDRFGLYGIKNQVFKAEDIQDIKQYAHFAVTWDGFFINNAYEGGGKVEITSNDDFRVLNSHGIEKIKIGALEWEDENNHITTIPSEGVGAPTLYGIRINDEQGDWVLKTGDNGNLSIKGTIYANAGEIGGMVVNDDWLRMNYIVLEPGVGIYSTYPNRKGETPVDPTISAYPFWINDTDGSAIFNNVTVRGAIRTSVFEYEEIQAVGGAFMFRPSSTIKTARVSNNDLIVTVEKPLIIQDGSWYKISNYNGNDDEVTPEELTTFGLTHIYPITKQRVVDSEGKVHYDITLIGAAAILEAININDLPGGSIIDMGFAPNTYRPISLIPESSPILLHLYELVNGEYVLSADNVVDPNKTYYKECYQNGVNNYGIGINSSDNFINLPPRSISLFETVVDPTASLKVSYRYRGIFGTLPDERLNNLNVKSSIYPYMRGTQGIYTDNIYIGDNEQYLAFYTDSNGKHLRIQARDIIYGVDDAGNDVTWEDKIDSIEYEGGVGQDSIDVVVTSSNGDKFLNGNISTTLICQVIKGGTQDITQSINQFTWRKINKNNAEVINDDWPKTIASNTLNITSADIDSKATFICEIVLATREDDNGGGE